MDLTGKTALITGASRGIGAATARAFAEAGAKVALVARSRDAIADLAGEIGPAAVAIPCEISRYWEVEQAVQNCLRAFGSLDILVNNAGVIDPIAPLGASDPADWDALIDINIKGVYHGMRAALPVMEEAGGGTILTIGSGAAQRPLEGWSAYCTSKAGALMLTRAADEEYRDKGIRAMSLSPGTVATDMQRTIKASGVNAVSELDWSDHIPPEWVAQTLLWMCNSEADRFLGGEISLRDEDIRKTVGVA
ncbi:MAG: NAD(P)-dependent oxidoreductase [Rhodobacteraceae bacterium]|jgi:NAD(P)-dependent dehydrogenase (short-subunit alcohol dehydrogenase family)|uniref:Short-chain alcohol dehydrogenase n=1 Tax=Salipiger profundus TaxID=1229727 RepID=A0A1U7D5E4_9RHOB|nr:MULTISPECIES: SDR family oxidoreductase [Salipiger]APX23371.1 short-chain alcohol dehydrogenase [Salipiger profundus]MAB09136.1 NAD(P)-dependent oxidoreductase [Paracoccaceae bacterium]GGA24227.1 short-chain dehydrogenase [Salipiger profundus]SFD45312.1 NADP-dependent 3-hydroxy acid dehydrogenase YdfG [Salipiger profundus]